PHASLQVAELDDAERHIDGGRGLLFVFDFRLGKRGAAVETPVHGLHALVEMPILDDAAEGAQLLRLVSRRHGEIRMIPVPEHTETLEVRALLIHLLLGESPAGSPERRGVELLSRAAMLLLHL